MHAACFFLFTRIFFHQPYSISPEGNSASPVVVQQPVQPPQPKWPLKPGVLVHVNNARFSQGLGLSMASSLSSLPKTSTPNKPNVGSSNPTRSRSNKKLWNVQRRRAISLGSLAQADDTSQRSRANRIRKMFSHERLDSLPTGFYQGKSGGIIFFFLLPAFLIVCRM